MATQWISKHKAPREAAPPTWCPLLQRSVPCSALEVWRIRADGRLGERVMAPSGEPVRVPVGHHGEMSNFLYGDRGRFALIARDHRGRLAGRRDFEETDDFCWAGPKTTEQRLNEQIGALQAELCESRARCAALQGEVRQLETAARAAKYARARADMEQKSREALLEVKIGLLERAAHRAELNRKAPGPKGKKNGLPDIRQTVDIVTHVIERVDRIANRSGKTENKRVAGKASSEEPPGESSDGTAQPDTGGG